MSVSYAEVIGDPIAHSKSPLIHGFWLGKLGLDANYDRCRVTGEELGDYFAARREDETWQGCNVTIPHKEAIMPHLDGIEDVVRAIGAVNTVFRDASGVLWGTNTDIDGVAEALSGARAQGPVVVIGNGGAARAAFAHLARADCEDVCVVARDPEKARRVAADCGLGAKTLPLDPEADALKDATVVINATQLGMLGQSPMPKWICDQLDRTDPQAVVFDMVYAPLETPLLAVARATGRKPADGLVMLVGQAAAAFERFFGKAAPREHDSELRGILMA